MINFINTEIGDKFLLTNGCEASIILKTNDALILDQDGMTLMIDYYGLTQHASGGLSVASKVGAPPWLKDLPDADLFHKDVDSLIYEMDSAVGNWYVTDEDGGQHWCGMKMPRLTISQSGKGSHITIEDLREWQKNN